MMMPDDSGSPSDDEDEDDSTRGCAAAAAVAGLPALARRPPRPSRLPCPSPPGPFQCRAGRRPRAPCQFGRHSEPRGAPRRRRPPTAPARLCSIRTPPPSSPTATSCASTFTSAIFHPPPPPYPRIHHLLQVEFGGAGGFELDEDEGETATTTGPSTTTRTTARTTSDVLLIEVNYTRVCGAGRRTCARVRRRRGRRASESKDGNERAAVARCAAGDARGNPRARVPAAAARNRPERSHRVDHVPPASSWFLNAAWRQRAASSCSLPSTRARCRRRAERRGDAAAGECAGSPPIVRPHPATRRSPAPSRTCARAADLPRPLRRRPPRTNPRRLAQGEDRGGVAPARHVAVGGDAARRRGGGGDDPRRRRASWGGRWRWTGTRWTPEGLALPLRSRPSCGGSGAVGGSACPRAIQRAAARRIPGRRCAGLPGQTYVWREGAWRDG